MSHPPVRNSPHLTLPLPPPPPPPPPSPPLPQAFDAATGAPTDATLAALVAAFRTTLFGYGGSAFTATIQGVTDALSANPVVTLYPVPAPARRLTAAAVHITNSIRVTYAVASSSASTRTITTLVGNTADFATSAAAALTTALGGGTIGGAIGTAVLTGIPTPAPTARPTTATPSVAPSPFAPTAAPTTYAPSVVGQTLAPSVAPTSSAPTVEPTSAAPTSAAPTVPVPSALPTTDAPTLEPTVYVASFGGDTPAPSAAPSLITKVPSIAPSVAPTVKNGDPTAAPTIETTTKVQVSQTIAGIDLATAQSVPFKNALATSIAYTLGIERSRVEVTDVSSAARLRLLAGITVAYTVTTVNTPAAAVASMLKAVIAQGTLTTVLQTNGYPQAVASTAPTAVVDLSPTGAPSASPYRFSFHLMLSGAERGQVGRLGGWDVAGVAVAIVGVAMATWAI